MVARGSLYGILLIPDQLFTAPLIDLPQVVLALCAFGSLLSGAPHSLLRLIANF